MKQSLQIHLRRKQHIQTFSQKKRGHVCEKCKEFVSHQITSCGYCRFHHVIKTSRRVSDLTSSGPLIHPWIIYCFPGQEAETRNFIVRMNIMQI